MIGCARGARSPRRPRRVVSCRGSPRSAESPMLMLNRGLFAAALRGFGDHANRLIDAHEVWWQGRGQGRCRSPTTSAHQPVGQADSIHLTGQEQRGPRSSAPGSPSNGPVPIVRSRGRSRASACSRTLATPETGSSGPTSTQSSSRCSTAEYEARAEAPPASRRAGRRLHDAGAAARDDGEARSASLAQRPDQLVVGVVGRRPRQPNTLSAGPGWAGGPKPSTDLRLDPRRAATGWVHGEGRRVLRSGSSAVVARENFAAVRDGSAAMSCGCGGSSLVLLPRPSASIPRASRGAHLAPCGPTSWRLDEPRQQAAEQRDEDADRRPPPRCL